MLLKYFLLVLIIEMITKIGLGDDGCNSGSDMSCGKLCAQTCICGGKKLTWRSEKQCCVPIDTECSIEEEDDEDDDKNPEIVNCPEGSVQNFSRRCNGKCHFHVDRYNLERNFLPCENGKCVPVYPTKNLCVVPRCTDESDNKTFCQKEQFSCDKSNPSYTGCHRVVDGGSPGKCVKVSDVQEGNDNCTTETKEIIDFEPAKINFTKCETASKNPEPGIICDGICWPIYSWCSLSRSPRLCPEFGLGQTTKSKAVCELEQWRGITCNTSALSANLFFNGFNSSTIKRCTGTTPGECIDPESSYYRRTCTDRSDQIHLADEQCPYRKNKKLCQRTCERESDENCLSCLDPNGCLNSSLCNIM